MNMNMNKRVRARQPADLAQAFTYERPAPPRPLRTVTSSRAETAATAHQPRRTPSAASSFLLTAWHSWRLRSRATRSCWSGSGAWGVLGEQL